MQKFKTYILLLVVLFAFSLSGCKKAPAPENEVKDNGTVVFTYGDSIITKGEVYIYIHTVKDRYELQYGKDVWEVTLPSTDGDDASFVDLTREEVVNEIIRVKALVANAETYGVTLSEADNSEISEKTSEIYEGFTDDDLEKMELSYDNIYKVISENKIANLVEEAILEENPVEISDEVARKTTFFDMYFDCYEIDGQSNVTPYTEEERALQYEKALQACASLATADLSEDENSGDIEKLSDYYNLEQAKEYTLTPTEILEIYGQEIFDTLYAMENGQYTAVIESEYGYHVFEMIALTDEVATRENKERITKETIAIEIEDTLDEMKNRIDKNFVYPDSINMDVYNTISID